MRSAALNSPPAKPRSGLLARCLKVLTATLLGLLLCWGLSGPLGAVDFQLRSSRDASASVLVGLDQTFDLDFVIQNDVQAEDGAIQGFQLAISHDSDFLEFESITWEGTDLLSLDLNGGEGPSFYLVQEVPAPTPGITLGTIFQQDIFSFFLGAGEHTVSRLRYRGTRVTPVDQTAAVAFADSLGQPAVENKYTVRSGETLSPANRSSANVIIRAVSYSIHFGTSGLQVEQGTDISIPILIENSPLPVSGFSLGVSHTGNLLAFKELQAADGLTSVTGPITFDPEPSLVEGSAFLALNTSPPNGTGFTVAVILNSSDPSRVLDPANSPHQVFTAIYTAQSEGLAAVTITGELGTPPVATLLDLAGVAQEPVLSPENPRDVAVNIGRGGIVGEPFRRGDVDQGGSINITDPLSILGFLFRFNSVRNPAVLDTIENCIIAFNADGATNAMGVEGPGSVNLNDAIFLLNFLFLSGPRPRDPFPDCGTSPNDLAPEFACKDFNCN